MIHFIEALFCDCSYVPLFRIIFESDLMNPVSSVLENASDHDKPEFVCILVDEK